MKDKEFTKNAKRNLPKKTKRNKESAMKEETALIRVNKEAQEIAKNYAFKNDTTMKEYVEGLIFQDEKKRNLEI